MSAYTLPPRVAGLEPTLPSAWYVSILEPRAPAHTDIVCHFLFEPFEIAKPDFDPRDTTEFWDLVNRQDWEICEAVPHGMASRVHEQRYYAPTGDSLDTRGYVLERIGDVVEAT